MSAVAAVLVLSLGQAGAQSGPAGGPARAQAASPAGAQQDVRLIPPLPVPFLARPGDPERERGLQFRVTPLSGAPVSPPEQEWPATPLPAASTSALLDRLPALPAADERPFRFPTASPPAPRAGAVVVAAFPADTVAGPRRPAGGPDAPAPAAAAPLRVLRIVPEGDAELVPHLTITFSEPMVPLAAVTDVESHVPPVRLAPRPPGRWTWIDVRTARFVAEPRMPMATTYDVEVPAGTRALSGAALPEAVRATFTTAPALAVGGYPARAGDDGAFRGRGGYGVPGGHPNARYAALDQVMLVAFDQRVDPAAVLRTTRLLAAGRSHPVRLATSAELSADSIARLLADSARAGYWLAFVPAHALPSGADVRLVIDRGTASGEGAGVTAVPQELRFRTRGPLEVVAHECGWGDTCRPGQPWRIRFSNPLDSASWSDNSVRVTPALAGVRIERQDEHVVITGRTLPNTRYIVSLDPGIRDIFGQRLGRSATLTFDVATAEPTAQLHGAPMIVLDPGGPPRVLVRSMGTTALRVRVHAVTPADYPAFTTARANVGRPRLRTLDLPGRVVLERTIPVASEGGYGETHIDVGPALTGGYGHAIVIVEPMGGDEELRRETLAWVQSTRIGIAAAIDDEELLAWTTSLDDAQPLAGVTVRLLPSGNAATTDAAGIATVPLANEPDRIIVASRGGDTALLAGRSYWGDDGWSRQPRRATLRWYTASDRGLYQPGETAQLRGWIRVLDGGRTPRLGMVDQVTSVAYRVRGPRGEELVNGEMPVRGLGGFHAAIELPEALNLGYANIELQARGGAYVESMSHVHLQVQEFRRPEYEVTVEADAGPHVVGDVVDAVLRAQYYGGGGVASTGVRWRLQSMPGHFTPPGWREWRFGRAPWGMPRADGPPRSEELTGTTDGEGAHRLRVELLDVDPPFTSQLHVAAEVQDLTRQVGSGQTRLLVHPAAVHVGVRLSREWVRAGQSVDVETVVVDHDGAVVAGRPVEVAMERVQWTWRLTGGQYEVLESRTLCALTSASSPGRCTVESAAPGMYRLTVDVRDAAERVSRTEHVFWVAGGGGLWRPGEASQGTRLLPDRQEYQPGDTARILVEPPFHPAEGLLTIRRAGVVHTETFRVASASHELRIPIRDEHVPNFHVRVELVDSAGLRESSGSVAITVPPHSRRLDVRVLPQAPVLQPGAETWVDVEVRDAAGRAAAGAEVAVWMVDEAVLALGGFTVPDPLDHFFTAVHPRVRDEGTRPNVVPWPRSAGPGTLSGTLVSGLEQGQGVHGVIVTVEGTDATATTAFDGAFTIRGLRPGEHVLVFHMQDGSTIRRTALVPAEGVHLGSLVLTPSGEITVAATTFDAVAVPVAAAPLPPAPQQARAAGAAKAEGVEVRADFAPLAFFEPSVIADQDGRVRVQARLPGSLTRYRVIAIAAASVDRFGTGESTVTARRDLMVRVTAPRFLNFGDRFALPVLVQNMTESPIDVDVAIRGSGLALAEPHGRRVTLPAAGRAELRFDATVTHVGSAHIQAVAVANGAPAVNDAQLVSVPVYTPATTEAFAHHGEIDSGAPIILPVTVPRGVIAQFGGLDVTVTSTALHALTDAVVYLKAYPFEGSSHIASRLLAMAALRDVLHAFDAPGLGSREEVDAAAERDVARLVALQAADGGWGFWRPDEWSHPFVTLHVAHALQRATARGYRVPESVLRLAGDYLRAVENHARDWPQEARTALAAYALHVRHLMGDARALPEARTMVAQRAGELSVESMGWLLGVLATDPASREVTTELLRRIGNRVDVTAGTATFAERYTDGEHLLLHSNRRTDAIVLDALIVADPQHDLIARLAQSLLAHRTAGAWRGTQENAWVLLALDRYFRTYEAVSPDFSAGVWLGGRYAGGHAFRGRSTERAQVQVPMPQLAETPATEVAIAREGTGRLYYRAALRYAPVDPRIDPLQRGFTVSRRYEGVDDPADVRQDADGTWRIRAGARVRSVVTMVAPSVRHHVALVDPLPAGFEPVNPELRGTGLDDQPRVAPGRPAMARLPAPGWFSHQNLRDDRAEAFATLLPAGTYEYVYIARATTPGTFVVGPPRAEMMYEPETFGHGTGGQVIVEP